MPAEANEQPQQTHWQLCIVVNNREEIIRTWPVAVATEANAVNEAKCQRKVLGVGITIYKVFADHSRELVNFYPSLAMSATWAQAPRDV